MDEMARKAGIDRLEFRRRNSDNPVRAAEYDIGARAFGWAEKNEAAKSSGPIKRGVGVQAGALRFPSFPMLSHTLLYSLYIQSFRRDHGNTRFPPFPPICYQSPHKSPHSLDRPPLCCPAEVSLRCDAPSQLRQGYLSGESQRRVYEAATPP